MLYRKRWILLKKKTSQKLRNCPNFRYSKYSRIVKFGQDCEILAFSGNFSITYILYEFSMIICTINISLWRSSLNVFVIVFVFCICLRRCLFVELILRHFVRIKLKTSTEFSWSLLRLCFIPEVLCLLLETSTGNGMINWKTLIWFCDYSRWFCVKSVHFSFLTFIFRSDHL